MILPEIFTWKQDSRYSNEKAGNLRPESGDLAGLK